MKRMQDVVLGIDSSTQSTKVVVLDLESGRILSEGRAPHTGADTQDPRDWWSALVTAIRVSRSEDFRVRGIAVAGQQHGLVTLDRLCEPVRTAPLWNNTDSAPDAERLNELADFAAETGTRLVASITISKLAYLARTAPADLARTTAICLPHDYLNLHLTGLLSSDRSDASGTGWWSAGSGGMRRDLIAIATDDDFAARISLTDVLGPDELAGTLTLAAATELDLPTGIPVGPGAGDNAAAAIGIGATSNELVISLGTSGVAFAVSDNPTSDPSGEVCGFADATGRFLPLVCMLNCTRVVGGLADLFGLSIQDALDLAGTVEPGAGGLLFMPYLAGERTPNLPNATGSIDGLTMQNLDKAQLLRAAVDGVAAGLAYCQEALAHQEVERAGVTLVGGGSRHPTWQLAITDATGLPVTVRGGGEHVARGAAIQIAAIVREEPVAKLAEAWRPEIVDRIEPRPEFKASFRLAERRAMIEALKNPT